MKKISNTPTYEYINTEESNVVGGLTFTWTTEEERKPHRIRGKKKNVLHGGP